MAKTKTPKNKPPEKEQNDTSSFDQQSTGAKDSTASKNRKDKLAEDGNAYIEIPDVADIPGQENIVNAGVPGAMADTTISSDDEEGIRDGKDILEEDDDDTKIVMGTDADVTPEDLALLGDPDQDMDMNEDELVRKEGLDDVDLDGDPLNEAAVNEDSTGDDLDMPEEDKDPKKNEDDEENDYYSLGGGDKDALNEGRRDD
jgi:hypothetical protein